MNLTRRHLRYLVPALLAKAGASAEGAALPSKTYRFEDLTPRTNGKNRSWAIQNGKTHTGYPVEMHITELGSGMMPHAAHRHAHEETVVVIEGTIEVTISGKASTLGPGSVAYVASNEEHGWKNVGASPARYFVLALGRDS